MKFRKFQRNDQLTHSHGKTLHQPLKHWFGGIGTDTLLKVDLSFNDIKTNGDRCISEFLSLFGTLNGLFGLVFFFFGEALVGLTEEGAAPVAV